MVEFNGILANVLLGGRHSWPKKTRLKQWRGKTESNSCLEICVLLEGENKNLMWAEMLLILSAHHFKVLSVSMWMEGYMLQTSYFGFHIPQYNPFVAYAHTLSGIGCHQGCSGSSGTNVGLEVASWGGIFQTIQGLPVKLPRCPPWEWQLPTKDQLANTSAAIPRNSPLYLPQRADWALGCSCKQGILLCHLTRCKAEKYICGFCGMDGFSLTSAHFMTVLECSKNVSSLL